jgi:hypothetical protein
LFCVFFVFFLSVCGATYSAETDEDTEPLPLPMVLVSLGDFLNSDFSLDGLRQLLITTFEVRNLTNPWTENLYAQLTRSMRNGKALYLAGEAYPLVIRLAADCGERIVFYCDEMLPAAEGGAIFHLDENLRHQVGAFSISYPYSPTEKDNGPPLKETGNAVVLISADIRLSETETRTLPVAIYFPYGNGRVFYTSFQIAKNAKSEESRNFSAVVTNFIYGLPDRRQ